MSKGSCIILTSTDALHKFSNKSIKNVVCLFEFTKKDVEKVKQLKVNALSISAEEFSTNTGLVQDFTKSRNQIQYSPVFHAVDSNLFRPRIVYGFVECNIVVLKNNEVYRVGDMMRNLQKIVKPLMERPEYENTIMRHYFTQKNKKGGVSGERGLLKSILHFEEKNNWTSRKDANSIVVHVRSGDDYKGRGIGNVKRRQTLQKEINSLLKSKKNINRIVIVTALHYGVNLGSKLYPSRSLHRYSFREENKQQNFKCLQQFANAQSVPVTFQSSNDIDYDLWYLTSAQHLLVTGGAFSVLAQKLNKLYKTKN